MTTETQSTFRSPANNLARKILSTPMICITFLVICYMVYRTKSCKGGYAIYYIILLLSLGYWIGMALQAWGDGSRIMASIALILSQNLVQAVWIFCSYYYISMKKIFDDQQIVNSTKFRCKMKFLMASAPTFILLNSIAFLITCYFDKDFTYGQDNGTGITYESVVGYYASFIQIVLLTVLMMAVFILLLGIKRAYKELGLKQQTYIQRKFTPDYAKFISHSLIIVGCMVVSIFKDLASIAYNVMDTHASYQIANYSLTAVYVYDVFLDLFCQYILVNLCRTATKQLQRHSKPQLGDLGPELDYNQDLSWLLNDQEGFDENNNYNQRRELNLLLVEQFVQYDDDLQQQQQQYQEDNNSNISDNYMELNSNLGLDSPQSVQFSCNDFAGNLNQD